MRVTSHTAGSIAFGLAVLVGFLAPAIAGEGDIKEKHWAYQPIMRPAVPAVSDLDWSRNPIDRFIRARMEAEGIKPAPGGRPPDLDPPALSRLDRSATVARGRSRPFLEDKSPDAINRVVDRLLASPRYGERWARHWLDVVRFAETNGYERDGAKPHAWRYRDYVIDALNHDKPYDRFLTEQLAGDEIEGSDASAQIATTFLRLGTWDDEPAEPKIDRYDQLDDVLGTTATAFLGITLRCARCHDHKFEPFSQVDYYRMLAVFEPLKRPQNDRADLDRPVGTEAELAAYHAQLARADADFAATWARIEALVKPEIDAAARADARLQGRQSAAEAARRFLPIAVATFRLAAVTANAGSSGDCQGLRREAGGRGSRARACRGAGRAASRWKRSSPPSRRPARSFLAPTSGTRRGRRHRSLTYSSAATLTSQGIAVEPGLPAVLAAKAARPPRPTARSSGRRLWLARWLT